MTDAVALLLLLLVMLVLGGLLVLASSITLGRKLADLEFQVATDVNGVRRIQSYINVRTHANRVVLGLVFVAVSVIALTDVPELMRIWTARILFPLVLLAYTASSILDWIDERRQMKMLLAITRGGQERRDIQASADMESYRQMAAEAVSNLELAAAAARAARGDPPRESLAPVVPEHSSPTTVQQQQTADIATLRGRLVASTLDLRLPPREPGGAETPP